MNYSAPIDDRRGKDEVAALSTRYDIPSPVTPIRANRRSRRFHLLAGHAGQSCTVGLGWCAVMVSQTEFDRYIRKV